MKKSYFIADFILFLSRVINLYMYYVGFACLLSWVPNINPDYPLFHFIFVSTGFYLLPQIFGFVFAPLLVMTVCVLISQWLIKLYLKLTKDKRPEIIIMSPEDFFKKLEQENLKKNEEKTDKEDNNDSN